ncbi:MAG TPA: hypothetical protein VNI58_05875 [Mariprofundaceae bacterium]|nr:hypothetical protein [Mariprofundaceae bacterium]
MANGTLSDFYIRCDNLHRELYSVMAREWQEVGQAVRQSERGLKLCLRSVSVGGEEGLALFELLPGAGTAPASIVLNLNDWRRWFGEEEAEAMMRHVTDIQGLQHKSRDGVFSIIDPGHMSGPMQQALRNLVLQIARRGSDMVAR